MWILIKREIEDQFIYFIGAIAISVASVLVTLVCFYKTQELFMVGDFRKIMVPFFWSFVLLPFLSAAFGRSQIHIDHTKMACAFISSLATSRKIMLSAKIIAGLIWVFIMFAPVIVMDLYLCYTNALMPEKGAAALWHIFSTNILLNIACYSLGLMMGWNSSKILSSLGLIVITPVIMMIVVIKGFALVTFILLIFLALAMFSRTWQKFMTAAL